MFRLYTLKAVYIVFSSCGSKGAKSRHAIHFGYFVVLEATLMRFSFDSFTLNGGIDELTALKG